LSTTEVTSHLPKPHYEGLSLVSYNSSSSSSDDGCGGVVVLVVVIVVVVLVVVAAAVVLVAAAVVIVAAAAVALFITQEKALTLAEQTSYSNKSVARKLWIPVEKT
jgi:type IV secretory pathway TrbL component